MYFNKKKKIVFLTFGSIILTSAIIVPILVIKFSSTNQDEKEIISKKEINSSIVQNSNIVNGKNSNFIEDDFKNFWSMSDGKKLQVLKFDQNKNDYVNSWTDDNGLNGEKLLNGSKIINGKEGIIFKDSFGNLWATGYNTKLQVLAKKQNNSYADSWVSDPKQEGLLKNSNIDDGQGGTIFQDKSGNLWAMATGTSLQVLRINSDGTDYENAWVNDNDENTGDTLLKNSNIDDGQGGIIFEDNFGNIWTAGYETELQVLVKNKNGTFANKWVNSTGQGLLKSSNFDDGFQGMIFQDIFNNLWTIGFNLKLQILKVNSSKNGYVIEGWSDNNSQNGEKLLKNSKIENGESGMIFQDSFGNLWAMGKTSKLQVLKIKTSGNGYVDEGWIDDNTENGEKLLKNSNIDDGYGGKIFQDSSKNLWAMGNGAKLQVLKANSSKDAYVETGWTEDNNENGEKLLKGSNINDGYNGIIFQDSFGNLWSIGYQSKLQAFDKKIKKWIS